MIFIHRINKKFFFGLLVAILLVACVKNDYTQISTRIVWNPNFSVPLGKSYFSASDLTPVNGVNFFDVNNTFFVADTIPFDFSELFINTESINYVMFRTYVENGFPAKLSAQAYFIDGANSIVDSVYADGPILLSAADVDSEGNLLSTIEITTDEYRSDSGVDILEGVRKVWIKVWVYDFDPGGLSLDDLEEYFIKLEIGFQTDVEKENKK